MTFSPTVCSFVVQNSILTVPGSPWRCTNEVFRGLRYTLSGIQRKDPTITLGHFVGASSLRKDPPSHFCNCTLLSYSEYETTPPLPPAISSPTHSLIELMRFVFSRNPTHPSSFSSAGDESIQVCIGCIQDFNTPDLVIFAIRDGRFIPYIIGHHATSVQSCKRLADKTPDSSNCKHASFCGRR